MVVQEAGGRCGRREGGGLGGDSGGEGEGGGVERTGGDVRSGSGGRRGEEWAGVEEG